MTSDLDVCRSAWLIIRRHGEDAIVHAAMRRRPAVRLTGIYQTLLRRLRDA